MPTSTTLAFTGQQTRKVNGSRLFSSSRRSTAVVVHTARHQRPDRHGKWGKTPRKNGKHASGKRPVFHQIKPPTTPARMPGKHQFSGRWCRALIVRQALLTLLQQGFKQGAVGGSPRCSANYADHRLCLGLTADRGNHDLFFGPFHAQPPRHDSRGAVGHPLLVPAVAINSVGKRATPGRPQPSAFQKNRK